MSWGNERLEGLEPPEDYLEWWERCTRVRGEIAPTDDYPEVETNLVDRDGKTRAVVHTVTREGYYAAKEAA